MPKRKTYTKTEIAARLGVSKSRVTQYVRGRRRSDGGWIDPVLVEGKHYRVAQHRAGAHTYDALEFFESAVREITKRQEAYRSRLGGTSEEDSKH
jgi:hypothetical protein